MDDILKGLFALQDEGYRNFQSKLMPEIPYERVIGVRTPLLRKYAKEVAKRQDVEAFLQTLPHTYYEENNLHEELLILLYKDIDIFLVELEKFLPYIDNWATCDLLSPKLFKKHLACVYEKVKEWLKSKETYTIRFGIVTLLYFYLDDAFEPHMLELVAEVDSEEYYVKMAVAWYFSIALVKQYEATIPYLENPVLLKWTHNKALQKAIESRQIDAETKKYLKSLKIK